MYVNFLSTYSDKPDMLLDTILGPEYDDIIEQNCELSQRASPSVQSRE